MPYVLGGVAVIAIVAALAFDERRGSAARAAGSTGAEPASTEGAPPDLSAMTPRERFDRLYNRVMQATEAGDTATMARFSPMAVAAYGMLDQVDADARYHAAMLRLHGGDAAGAAALADTILAENPKHLLGWVIRGTLARYRKDDPGFRAVQRSFLASYDGEQAAGRSEYRDHSVILDRFREEARKASGGTTP